MYYLLVPVFLFSDVPAISCAPGQVFKTLAPSRKNAIREMIETTSTILGVYAAYPLKGESKPLCKSECNLTIQCHDVTLRRLWAGRIEECKQV